MSKFLSAVLAAASFGPAFGAEVPGSVNPATIMNSVNSTLPAPEAPAVKDTLKEPDSTQTADLSPQASARLVLRDVQVSGATHAVPAEVAAVYRPLIGQTITFGAVQKMAADMQAAYRNRGQFLVQVVLPPQQISQDNAVIQVRLVEGQIEKVNLEQPLPRALKAQMQRYARRVEAQDPVSYASVDRFLLLANDLPGMQASATLAPDPEVTGGSDLLMTTRHRRWSAFSNYNNYGTKYVGPNQLSLGASLYGLVAADSLSLAAATTPNRASALGYGNIDYGIVLGAQATLVNASVTLVKTEPGNSLSPFNLQGKSWQYTLGVQQPLHVSTKYRITLLASLSHLDNSNDVFEDQELYTDAITPLIVGVAYQGAMGRVYNDIKLTATQGLSFLGAKTYMTNPSVAGATPDYLRLNLESTTIRYVSARTSVALAAQIQMSRDRLVSSERISHGGAQFGQAYHYNVISGDRGALGSLALRYDVPVHGWLNQLQPEIFYDAGTVHLNQSPPGERNSANATSAGAGVNLLAFDRYKARVTLAKPLSQTNAPEAGRDWQGYFNVTAVF